MKVSQLIHAMDRDDIIVIEDFDKPIDKMTLYIGNARGIRRDDPINKMHVSHLCADGDVIRVLVEKQKKKGERYESWYSTHLRKIN